jgi:hypothetical protein
MTDATGSATDWVTMAEDFVAPPDEILRTLGSAW